MDTIKRPAFEGRVLFNFTKLGEQGLVRAVYP